VLRSGERLDGVSRVESDARDGLDLVAVVAAGEVVPEVSVVALRRDVREDLPGDESLANPQVGDPASGFTVKRIVTPSTSGTHFFLLGWLASLATSRRKNVGKNAPLAPSGRSRTIRSAIPPAVSR
jgi:hypothetical protein